MPDIFNLEKQRNVNPFNVGVPGGIRGGIQEFIDRHGIWMLFVRRDLRYPSPLFEASQKSPNADEQFAFGAGTKVQYEKHKVRRVQVAGSAQSPIEKFGYLAKFRTIIYCPRYYYPKSKDIYMEVEWDTPLDMIEQYGKPTKVINAFQVDEALFFKEDEVSYIACGCDTYNFDIETLNKWVLELGPVYVPKRVI